MAEPLYFAIFEILYWTGIREGELLALSPDSFDWKRNTMRIDKSYQRLGSKDVITDPKTPKSIRTIKLSKFLAEEIKDYLSRHPKIGSNDRMFKVSKHQLAKAMTRGCNESGVKRIRIHDLRHSHVSLLINMSFTALAIADRMGHEATDITFKYAHLFPSVQDEMAEELEVERGGF
ncbi:site-specific integrase [Bifidobacterium magnum]|uniref:site-specific integrase n=1 Tax=Bifidobacterium magnum TaxID=1692 RepID=UPI000A848A5C|nr:site-specific integrase [Bifidobacterium magnum]